jgi:hypothetical protein
MSPEADVAVAEVALGKRYLDAQRGSHNMQQAITERCSLVRGR